MKNQRFSTHRLFDIARIASSKANATTAIHETVTACSDTHPAYLPATMPEASGNKKRSTGNLPNAEN